MVSTNKKIKGLIAAPFTPMKSNGDINLIQVKAYADHLKANNVKGAFVCGTTGEGMLLTLDERKALAEEWVKEQTEDFKVIVHVGTTSARQSRMLAQHAQSSGACAVGTMGPIFLRPSAIEELVQFCAEIASGSPEIPFYYYHIPSVSGIGLSMLDFLERAQKVIPNLAGIKFTHNNFMEMQQCLQLDEGKWDILHGFDEVLLAGLSFGIEGAVGSTYNFMAPLYNRIIEDFENGDLISARQSQSLSVKVVEVLVKNNGAIVAGKALMNRLGIDCGRCRWPLKNLTFEESLKMEKELTDLGFDEWIRSAR
ncbi:dihydrodipicolinate synthase family protein [Marinilongibacter aquaticus]|uniref:dihydrodipicolinate synthase family protein n=1 Tax=Marinilongibacter aquaticus TaxID=2975157 RepID=UPI0021BDE434|nr:dihydrodipicolinate synthase family protein [Marinilongibacter aquaticus]UBM58674.1 dihydrodipicolinate synthase family protein [Marinilongibacter aquaticus]